MKTITNLLLLIAVFYNSTRIYGNENSPDLSKPVAIISYYNKNVIDLPRGTTENGAKIASWTYNQQDNQLWWFQKENNGYIIISKFSRQVLAADPADSSVVQLPFDSNNKYQYWNILSFEDSTHIMNNELKLPLSLSVEKNNISLSKVESSNCSLWKIMNYSSGIAEFIYGSYLDLLKKEPGYCISGFSIPKFTYENPENPHLVSLRKNQKLDSVAGNGNEISKILNILHWIHWLIPHDGLHGNPPVMNAESLISVCAKEKRGLNCRGLATVLNECYLSLGFKSRFVTCLPKDSLGIDSDCHVINMVYSHDFKKWIWIDPTNDAYIMDENGILLSIEEVRNRLIAGKTLIVNPDANWNRTQSQVKENYLQNYMAKNLYKFNCNLHSTYNTETFERGKTYITIHLLPNIDSSNKTGKVERKSDESDINWIDYVCSDPALFWQKPE